MPIHHRWSEQSIHANRRTSWQTLLDDQDGVVDVVQLRMHGITEAEVRANVSARRWRRVLPRVYATYTGDLSRRAAIHAALLYGGPYAVLSHRTAAEEWGMLPLADNPLDITVPYTASAVSKLPFVRVHRSKALAYSVADAHPRRTKRTDTIVDLAVEEPTPEEAQRLVVDLVSAAAVSIRDMMGCVEQRRPRRYHKAIVEAVELVRHGLMSALELEYLRSVEEDHGILSGDRQVPVSVAGKTLWEDVTYDNRGAPLTVRLDGRATHAMAWVAFRDRQRDNAAEIAERSRLVYGWSDVHGNPCAVAAEVRRVLRRRGCNLERNPCRCAAW